MVNLTEKINEHFAIGLPVINKLMGMTAGELKNVIREIAEEFAGEEYNELIANARVEKKIVNDVPEYIRLEYYDSIEITPFGIYSVGEHGGKRAIVLFNKYFNTTAI